MDSAEIEARSVGYTDPALAGDAATLHARWIECQHSNELAEVLIKG